MAGTYMANVSLARVTSNVDLPLLCKLQEPYINWIAKMMQSQYNIYLKPSEINDFNLDFISDWKLFSGPRGRFYLLSVEGTAAGIGGIKPISDSVAELKRLYVLDDYRGQGYGKIIISQLINDAEELGYEKIQLETLAFMQTAIRLYKSFGFQISAPFKGSEGKKHGIERYEFFMDLPISRAC